MKAQALPRQVAVRHVGARVGARRVMEPREERNSWAEWTSVLLAPTAGGGSSAGQMDVLEAPSMVQIQNGALTLAGVSSESWESGALGLQAQEFGLVCSWDRPCVC